MPALAVIQFLLVAAFLMAVLTWHQPGALFSLGRTLERLAEHIVREIRVRACALRDSRAAYARSAEWHRGRL